MNRDEEVDKNAKRNDANLFCCGTDKGNPEQARWALLACSGSQSEQRILFILPACGYSHIIIQYQSPDFDPGTYEKPPPPKRQRWLAGHLIKTFNFFFSTGGSNLEMFVSQSGPSGWPKSCPTGYSQHLGAIEQDCEVNFCVKSDVFNSHGLPIIKRPPYSDAPKVLNYSVPMLLVNEDNGQIWFKPSGNKPQWLLATKR